MRIHPFQAIFPDLDLITSPDSFFGTVKEDFPEYWEEGFFKKSAREGFYIYEIQTPFRSYTGLMTGVAIEDYLEGKIKKHENTLAFKEQKQMHLMLHRKAIVKPVLLVHRPIEKLEKFIRKYKEERSPFFSTFFENGSQKHVFWQVNEEEEIDLIRNFFARDVPHAYIADGHHRTSTIALLHSRQKNQSLPEKYNLLLCAFFPYQELKIHDFNRVVDTPDNFSPTIFMAKVSQLFDIEILSDPIKPAGKFEVVMFLNREWFRLKWKKEIIDLQKEEVVFDTRLLDEYVLKKILNIEGLGTDSRVKYVSGSEGIQELENTFLQNEQCIGFCLHPVALEDMLKVADAGKVLPPKSTWFEPRMKNGLIVLKT